MTVLNMFQPSQDDGLRAQPADAPEGVDVAATAPAHREPAVRHPIDPERAALPASAPDLLKLLRTAMDQFGLGVALFDPAEQAPALVLFGKPPAAPADARVDRVRRPELRDDGVPCAASESDRLLRALVFIDIVNSTAAAERLGDLAWQLLLRQYRAIVREQLALERGCEIDCAGDGFFLTFQSPARAIRCVERVRRSLAQIGVDIRAGIHVGECECAPGHVSGVAVHVTARLAEIAQPGEILVSATVRDLVAGSGLEFTAVRSRVLRGLTGVRKTCAVKRSTPASDALR